MMQNRYVGDVGDFAKYALLRRLIGLAGNRMVRLGIVWCLYPDETHNDDGRHISYLRRPEFGPLDPELIRALRDIVETNQRSVAAVAAARILPRDTIFCDGATCMPAGAPSTRETRLRHRSDWLERCFRLTECRELVFFDPDNGIEIASVPKHHVKAGKYIYWDELTPFWQRGQALLVYHHLNRTMPASDQVTELRMRLRAKFDCAHLKPLVFRRGSCRVFWLVCPPTSLGLEISRRADEFLNGRWAAHFRPFGCRSFVSL